MQKPNRELQLRNAVWSLSLLPEKGACLVSCECLGFPVLKSADLSEVEAGDVFTSSCFPLVPYSNRIENGRFSFLGQTHEIRKNHRGNIYPLHGNGWDRPWKVEKASETRCELSLTYLPEAGGWPWAYQAKQIVRLEGEKLSIQLSLKNIGTVSFPAGIGLHPSFSNAKTAQANFKARSMWVCDEWLIPTHKTDLTPQTDFSRSKDIQGLRLDNCFDGWDGHAEISWPEFPGNIHMDAGSKYSNLVVYMDPNNDHFCMEPVTHVNNALGMDAAKGMTVLEPGKSLIEAVNFLFVL